MFITCRLALLAAVLLTSAHGATDATDASVILSTPGTIVHDGVHRSFRVFAPPMDGALPLVLVLHGLHGDGKGMERYTRFSVLAQTEKFIVVYPDGLERKWNDRAYTAGSTDDVGFLSALLDEIETMYVVDSARVYVTGASNGGMMANRLACDLGHRFAAVAPVIADMARLVMRRCDSAAAMPILMINGTDDPFVPFGLDTSRPGKKAWVSAVDTVDFWVTKNGCATPANVKAVPDRDPKDGTTVERRVYKAGAPGADVVFYVVQGGGHTWPGAAIQYLPEQFVGKTSQDIDATKVIWQFFKQHARVP